MSAKKELVQVSSYSRRLRENVKSILENYGEILKASKVGQHYCTTHYLTALRLLGCVDGYQISVLDW